MKIYADPAVFAKRRILLGLSQRDLARMAGLSNAYVSLLERSMKPVGPSTAKRLSEILQCDMQELFRIE